MNALTILKRCREAGGEIGRIRQRIDQRWEILTGMSAPQADPNGGSHGGADLDKNGRIMGDIDQLEREIQRRQERLEAEQISACCLLDLIPQLESKVLNRYYLKGWDTGKIARKEKYTAGYVRKIKRGGEQLLEMIPEEQVAGTLPKWYLREESEAAENGE